MNKINEMQIIEVKDMYSQDFYNKVDNMINKCFENLNQKQILQIIESYKIYTRKGFDGCIYFIKDCDRNIIKIGKTNNLTKRIKDFKDNYDFCGLKPNLKIIACFLTLKEHLNFSERLFHNMFKDKRSYREWYNITEIDINNMFLELEYSENLYNCEVKDINYFTFDMYDKDFIKNELDFKCGCNLINNRLDYRNKHQSKNLISENILYDIAIFNMTSEIKLGCFNYEYKDNCIKTNLKTSYCLKNDKNKIITLESLSDYYVEHPIEIMSNSINSENVIK